MARFRHIATAQSRDGFGKAWIDEILRVTGNGAVLFGTCREFEDFMGRFGKLFG